jgi:hypothetical protein
MIYKLENVDVLLIHKTLGDWMPHQHANVASHVGRAKLSQLRKFEDPNGYFCSSRMRLSPT